MNLDNIFFVVVLYKCSIENSQTIITLNSYINKKKTPLFVYDNSPTKQYNNTHFEIGNFQIEYYHDEKNSGLSVAYNEALKKALERERKWLLLLDQDTFFTKEYIDEISLMDLVKSPENVVAIIPKVISMQNYNISPAKMQLGGLCRPIGVQSGISSTPITGINSGTLIETNFITSIGGFNPALPLDLLDHWYFREIYRANKVVLVLKSIIYQELSVAGKFEETVSIHRYESILKAEKIFLKEEGVFAMLIFNLRLIRRAIKQLQFKNKLYFKTTMRFFLR